MKVNTTAILFGLLSLCAVGIVMVLTGSSYDLLWSRNSESFAVIALAFIAGYLLSSFWGVCLIEPIGSFQGTRRYSGILFLYLLWGLIWGGAYLAASIITGNFAAAPDFFVVVSLVIMAAYSSVVIFPTSLKRLGKSRSAIFVMHGALIFFAGATLAWLEGQFQALERAFLAGNL